MNLVELFTEKDIVINRENIEQTQLFNNTYEKLLQEEIVEEGYLEELMEREKDYPTGLKLPEYGVAIPHCSFAHVKKSVIFVNVMKEPVKWKNMEDFEQDIDVSLVLSLVLAQGEDHMAILSKIIGLIQNNSFINNIISCDDEKNIYQLIRKEIGE